MECYSSALSPNMVGVLQLGAANYRAVKSLCLTSLNAERTSILLRAFVSGGKGDSLLISLMFFQCHLEEKLEALVWPFQCLP